jgi:hypothetical protein
VGTRTALTRTSGTVITSAWANLLRDHVVPFTTSDDVSSNGQLALNTSSKRLVTQLSSVVYPIAGAMPRVRATPALTGLSYSAGAQPVAWNTEAYDTDGLYNSGSSASRIVASRAGLWLFSYQFTWSAPPSSTLLQAYMGVNGFNSHGWQAATTTGAAAMSGCSMLLLSASDYVEVFINHNNAGTVTGLNANDYFQAIYLGPS